MSDEKLIGMLRREKVLVDLRLAEKLASSGFGKVGRKKLILSPIEALYLTFIGKLRVFRKDKELGFNELMEHFSKNNPKMLSQFLVYRDLRNRGYVVKEGYGEGIDFLVYDKGDYPNEPARLRVIGVDEGIPIKLERLLDILNFSVMNKKELKLAVIERRGEVVYYTLESFVKERISRED